MANKYFKSLEAEGRQEEWYQRFLVRANKRVQFYHVDTSWGKSHVLAAGNPVNPPLVCLHAMLTGSAHLLSEIQELADTYYVIAPDIPGHSVRGLPVRLGFEDQSHARWLKEIIDELRLGHFDLFGVSLGGYIALEFAMNWPDTVNHLGLVVPSGIVQASVIGGMMKIAWPLLKYRFNQSDENLKAFTEHLLSNWDEDWSYYLGDSFMDFKFPRKTPPLFNDEQLSSLTMPVLVLGAEDDLSFPGIPLVERVNKLIPQADAEVIHDSRHSPPTTDAFRQWMTDRIHRFLV